MVMWSDYEPINGFMEDWYVHKEMLKKGDITEEGYLEWKVNWPKFRYSNTFLHKNT